MSTPQFGYITPENLSLFTDLYELTMMQGYHNQAHNPVATFELFFRTLPQDRGYMIAAGLEQAIHYVESVTFSDRAIDYLNEEGFDDDFLDVLESFSFTGELRALPEGKAVFPNEPLLEVTAPILEAQLFETVLINQIGFQSLIATKAARMTDTVDRFGDDQTLVDFGSRRAHGSDAGLKAARAAYIGGFDGTSNVAAGDAFDIPIYGTMAHSWIQSFDTERAAFDAFVDEYGADSILLIDTYDTVAGATVAREVAESKDVDLAGVRLDSGDLTTLSKAVDEVLEETDIFISSGVDEYFIREFLTEDGVAAGFGSGTALVTSTDAPKVEGVYKLVAVEKGGTLAPSMKLSTGKVTYPGQKSVARVERDGEFESDTLGLRDERSELEGTEQLVSVIEDGKRVYDLPPVEQIQKTAGESIRKLPAAVRELEDPDTYPVELGPKLAARTDEVQSALEQQVANRE